MVALYVVAFLMVVAGVLAVLTGWDVVIRERGWTLFQAGVILATGGVLLVGVAAAIARLKRIDAELRRAVERLANPENFPLSSQEAVPRRAAPEPAATKAAQAGAPPVGTASALAAAAAATASAPAWAVDSPPSSPPPSESAPEPQARFADAADSLSSPPPPPPPPLPEEADDDSVAGEPTREEKDDLFEAAPTERDSAGATAREAPAIAVAEEVEAVARPSPPVVPSLAQEEVVEAEFEEVAEASPPAQQAEAEQAEVELAEEAAPTPAEEPAIVGTYASGPNTYTMYADGSIAAETPSGRYRFASLDELKAFIAAGGEDQPAGA